MEKVELFNIIADLANKNGADDQSRFDLGYQKALNDVIESVNKALDLADVSHRFEPWMFVPCDEFGWPMFKPKDEDLETFDRSLMACDDPRYVECAFWVNGLRKIVFKGYKVDGYGDNIIDENGVSIAQLTEKVEWNYDALASLNGG